MSLQLLQGYSSAEDDTADPAAALSDSDEPSVTGSGESDADEVSPPARKPAARPRRQRNPSHKDDGDSSLPSALEAFNEVSGPPEFLNNRVGEPEETREALGVLDRRGGDWRRRERKEPRPGAVVEAKPQLTGIHERVRSDIDGGNPLGSVAAGAGRGKRVITAANPGPEDAADLLRMCLQCGIPKTYSHARGMVCPVCNDRPPAEAKESEKKKGSTVKDKEKSKRMRGQSSHATWKSETEMALRQQFD